MAFNPEIASFIASKTNEELKVVATQCGIDATETSNAVFPYCMRELAIRFDKRSFVNICEEISANITAGHNEVNWARA